MKTGATSTFLARTGAAGGLVWARIVCAKKWQTAGAKRRKEFKGFHCSFVIEAKKADSIIRGK